MPDPLQELANESRITAAREMREQLSLVTAPVLSRIAVDLVPHLFRNEYGGAPAGHGDGWADALAKPSVTALPTLLVRVHRGTFGEDDAKQLLAAMQDVRVSQAALVAIGPAVAPAVRAMLGHAVPWFVDTDGLIQLLLAASLGVTTRVYEAKYVDADYFR